MPFYIARELAEKGLKLANLSGIRDVWKNGSREATYLLEMYLLSLLGGSLI